MFLHNFYQYVQIYMTRYDVVVAVTAELQRGRPNARPGSGRLMRLFEAKLLSVGGSGSRTHPWAAETTLTVRVVHFLLLRCLHRHLNVLARPLGLTRSSHQFRFKCWYWFDLEEIRKVSPQHKQPRCAQPHSRWHTNCYHKTCTHTHSRTHSRTHSLPGAKLTLTRLLSLLWL